MVELQEICSFRDVSPEFERHSCTLLGLFTDTAKFVEYRICTGERKYREELDEVVTQIMKLAGFPYSAHNFYHQFDNLRFPYYHHDLDTAVNRSDRVGAVLRKEVYRFIGIAIQDNDRVAFLNLVQDWKLTLMNVYRERIVEAVNTYNKFAENEKRYGMIPDPENW